MECLGDCVMVLKCLNEKVTRGPRLPQNTANTLYYFCTRATSSTSSGCRDASLTLNNMSEVSEVLIKHRLWMPTASPLCLAGDSPCCLVNGAFSSCQVYKEKNPNSQTREILRRHWGGSGSCKGSRTCGHVQNHKRRLGISSATWRAWVWLLEAETDARILRGEGLLRGSRASRGW